MLPRRQEKGEERNRLFPALLTFHSGRKEGREGKEGKGREGVGGRKEENLRQEAYHTFSHHPDKLRAFLLPSPAKYKSVCRSFSWKNVCPVHLSGLSPKWHSALQPASRLSSACEVHFKDGETEASGNESREQRSQTYRRSWAAQWAGRTTGTTA